MLTVDERAQAQKFQSDLAEVVDQYLREGMDPDIIAETLRDEASSDLFARRMELAASD